MNNKEKTKQEFEKIKKLPAETVIKNMMTVSNCYHEDYVFSKIEELIEHVEKNIFDDEDTLIYNELLGRKPISYNFFPSPTTKSWAILAILSNIKP